MLELKKFEHDNLRCDNVKLMFDCISAVESGL